MRILWIKEKCRADEGCMECVKACPKRALSLSGGVLSYCRHCNPKYAACISACPRGALSADEAGVIRPGPGCDACGKCVSACPSRGVRLEAGKIVKCDLCAGAEAKKCVEACPWGALVLDEGERGCLLEVLPAVEFGPASSKDAVRVRAPPIKPQPTVGNGFELRFVGDGRKVPTVRSGESFGRGGGRELFSPFSFRNLSLPPREKAELVESKGKFKVFRLGGTRMVYYCDLPAFSEEEWEIARQAKHFTIRDCARELFPVGGTEEYFAREARDERLSRVAGRAEAVLGELDALMPAQKRKELARVIAFDTAGFGAIEFLWSGSEGELEEIEVNHPHREISVYHRRFGRCVTNLAFTGERGFRRVVNSILQPLGRSLDASHPAVDAQLPDGSRLHAQVYPLSLSGASANIRFLAGDPWTIPGLVRSGTVSPEMAAFLWMAVESRRLSIVLTGPPASGKTSFLSSLLAFIPQGERVVSVEEDLNELRFYDSVIDWVPLRGVHEEKKAEAERLGGGAWAARSALDQVINALRMRPDRIVLGELRGAEAKRLFSSANLGVPFMATMHSNERGVSVVKRLHSPPMCVSSESLSSLDLVVGLGFDGVRRRRVNEVCELCWRSRGDFPEGLLSGVKSKAPLGGIVWRDGDEAAYANALFSLDCPHDGFVEGARLPSRSLALFAALFGLKKGEADAELRRRAVFIKGLADSGVTGFIEFGRAVQKYSGEGRLEPCDVAVARGVRVGFG